MDLKFECPSCGQHLSATRVQIGVTAPCPNCNAAVTVPKTSTLPHPPGETELPKKKRYKTTVILIGTGAAAVPAKTKEVKKWTDDPAKSRNWLMDQLSEIQAGKYMGGIFDQKMVEVMMPSRTERLAFWRDEYALDSFTVLQRLLPFILSQSQKGQMRTWLTVSATILYARPFKQWPEVRLAEDDVPIKYREVHKEVLKYRDKIIAHRNPDAPKRDVLGGNELPIVSDGSNIRIPTTNPAMENGIAGSLLELVEILIPMLKARSLSFVSKYLPGPLAPGAYVLSLEANPAEWLKPSTPT